MEVADRFWAKVEKTDGCWLWTASTINSGYGAVGFMGHRTTAHRMSWFLAHGSWPDLCVLHRCDVKLCVRPDHLFLGTQADNVRDMDEKGRRRNAQDRKECCIKGHALSGKNVYIGPTGRRNCVTCRRERSTAWQRSHPDRHREAVRRSKAKATAAIINSIT